MKVNILARMNGNTFDLGQVHVTSMDTYRAELSAALHELADFILNEDPPDDAHETTAPGTS